MDFLEYNKTEILNQLNGLSEEDRTRLLLSQGITEEDLMRLLTHENPYVFEDEHHINEIKHVQRTLLLYVPPFLLVLGFIGNILSFIILRQRLLTKQSTYLYLAALTVADSLVLMVGPLRLWISQFMGYDLKDQSAGLCKMVVFLGYTTSDISVWLIIAVTVERYIVVCHPLHAISMCNIPRAKKVILLMVLFLAAFNLHFFWTVELSNNKKRNTLHVIDESDFVCSGKQEFVHLVDDLWPWIDAIIYSFLPFFVITILNCVIIRHVTMAYRSRCVMQKRGTISSESCRVSTCSDSNTRLTAMLLTVSFAFLLTTLPMNVCLIVADIGSLRNDRLSVARFNLAQNVTTLLMYTNHSINFFLYCATGQKFRHQLLKLLCSQKFAPLFLKRPNEKQPSPTLVIHRPLTVCNGQSSYKTKASYV